MAANVAVAWATLGGRQLRRSAGKVPAVRGSGRLGVSRRQAVEKRRRQDAGATARARAEVGLRVLPDVGMLMGPA